LASAVEIAGRVAKAVRVCRRRTYPFNVIVLRTSVRSAEK
jgi:hypothetical protein